MYYTYMIRCKDNSIYTGMTNDIDKRMTEHFTQDKKAAKYTKSHEPVKIEAVWQTKEKSNACKLEYRIKELTKKEKEELVEGTPLKEYLKGKIDARKYRRIKTDH